MKTNTNPLGWILLSCFLLLTVNFSALAQGQWPYPSPNAPIASGPFAGTVDIGNLENPDSQIWVKVNGTQTPNPHNKMHTNKSNVLAASYVTPGAAVEVNFNVNKNKNRFTLVSYSVDRSTGLRTLFDYQSNLYNNGNPVQGNSNQQLIKVPNNCDWEVYLVKGGIESNTVPPGSLPGSFMAAALPNSIITGPAGNPYAYSDPVTLRANNRILDYTYGTAAPNTVCADCPDIPIGSAMNQVYFRIIEVIDNPTAQTKQLIFSVINTTNTKDNIYANYDYIGDVLFTNILPAHHPRNNTPFQFRYNYQAGPQIANYTLVDPVTGPVFGPKNTFIFDQRNNHNNLNFSTYQSELFMFDVTYSEYTRLSNLIYDQTDPAYNPGVLPEICAELSSKHPEPGKTLHPVFCAYIDFECEPADCPVIEDSPCRYEDCCVIYEFAGGGGGGAITDTRLTFDLTFKPATCVKFNDVTKIVFTFPNVASIPYALNVLPAAGYNYSVVNNTVNYTPQGVFLTDVFAFDVPNTFILDPNAQTIDVTFEAGTESFTHQFDIVVITDQNNPPQTDCGLIVVLPVELVSFTGKALNEGIALNWKTASEKHNDRFEVERSYDGRNFETIGIVKGNGTSNVAHNYSFLDKHAKAGINYYRLNQVDFSGDNERTHIIKVVTDRSATALGVQLIPNPCLDQNCTVQLRNIDTSAPLTVELRDLTGRLIFSQQVPADQTSFQLPKVDTGNGIYILSARNGSHTAYQKIIIQ